MSISAPNIPIHGTISVRTCTAIVSGSVDSEHDVMFEWYRDNQLLTNTSDGRVVVSETVKTTTAYSDTLVHSPLANNSVDGGVYTCRVTVTPISDNRDYIISGSGEHNTSVVVRG